MIAGLRVFLSVVPCAFQTLGVGSNVPQFFIPPPVEQRVGSGRHSLGPGSSHEEITLPEDMYIYISLFSYLSFLCLPPPSLSPLPPLSPLPSLQILVMEVIEDEEGSNPVVSERVQVRTLGGVALPLVGLGTLGAGHYF